VFEEYFLATEQHAVHGGYILKHQDFWLLGDIVSISCLRLPISEGIVNTTYSGVGVQLLKSALKSNPLLFALGMGGLNQPLPRLLRVLGWSLWSVPFHFKVIHSGPVLANVRILRSTALRRLSFGAASATGLGSAVIKARQAVGRLRRTRDEGVSAVPVEQFDEWTDRVWQDCKTQYSMIGVRDSAALNRLYPPTEKKFIRLKINRHGATVGWAVLLDTTMRQHKQFGDLRVGSIVDCLAHPSEAPAVIEASTTALERADVDLIVSNQSHASWSRAFAGAGFLRGPSNFVFGASRDLSKRLEPFEESRTLIHLTRGDGDGPIHL
jgi:hypothetical protein